MRVVRVVLLSSSSASSSGTEKETNHSHVINHTYWCHPGEKIGNESDQGGESHLYYVENEPWTVLVRVLMHEAQSEEDCYLFFQSGDTLVSEAAIFSLLLEMHQNHQCVVGYSGSIVDQHSDGITLVLGSDDVSLPARVSWLHSEHGWMTRVTKEIPLDLWKFFGGLPSKHSLDIQCALLWKNLGLVRLVVHSDHTLSPPRPRVQVSISRRPWIIVGSIVSLLIGTGLYFHFHK
jgi:hypothetical protein